MRAQAISALAAPVLKDLSLPREVYDAWERSIVQQAARNCVVMYAQSGLPVTVPYAILKGTSAAQCYPNPKYRALGDIDIMTRREDYRAACDMLLADGYTECTSEGNLARGRHREFAKGETIVEVHSFFAMLNNAGYAEYLDNKIIESINPFHVLPDMINGLVLPGHISRHLEQGIGLRRIIDWMMFVNRCLPDKSRPEFQALARGTGHEKPAAVATKMCEMFLGLPERERCAEADPELCRQLMDCIMASGNCGRKQEEDSVVSQSFLSSTRTLKGALRFLQGRGLITWKAAQKHRFLRPFARIYQAGRYVGKGLARKNAFRRLALENKERAWRNALFDALGVSREENGIVRYGNGEYTKG